MNKTTKVLGVMAGLMLALYAAICIYFYNVQNDILFKPTVLSTDFQYPYSFDFDERWFDVTDNARIHAIHAQAPDSSKGLIFWAHGNGGNNNTRVNRFTLYLDEGYDVLYIDYRGYGKSTGMMENEEDLVGDMNLIYREMLKEYEEDDIIVAGYSLGSGVAAQVAAANDPRELILWAPYYSMVDMKDAEYGYLPDFLVRYPLRTDLALQKIEEPVTIFYADSDEVLPIERSMKLIDLLKETDRYIILEDQRHNRLHDNEQLQREMEKILRKN